MPWVLPFYGIHSCYISNPNPNPNPNPNLTLTLTVTLTLTLTLTLTVRVTCGIRSIRVLQRHPGGGQRGHIRSAARQDLGRQRREDDW